MKTKPISRRNTHGSTPSNFIDWKRAPLFLVNPRGILTHRIRHVQSLFDDGKCCRFTVDYWCGCHVNARKGCLTNDPPKERLLCERCEANAIEAGEKPASELVGRHVCIGRLRPVRICCTNECN